MPASKIVYTKAELFQVRDRMCDPSLESSGSQTPALPAFGAISPVVPQRSPLGEQQGSIRENLFGASAHSSRRMSSSAQQALPTSASGADIGSAGNAAPTTAVDALWLYRTKGGGKTSSAMPLKDIQQLVADELVEEGDIELRLADGVGAFTSLSEATQTAAQLHHLAASGSHNNNSTSNAAVASVSGDGGTTAAAAPVATERWRPGGGAASRQVPRAPAAAAAGLGSGPGGPSQAPTSLRGVSQLPPKHLNISRDEMMATEELKRPSPSAVSPPARSPAAAVLPSPIDLAVTLDVASADLGLGTVPTPTASVPLPPCGLGGDRLAPMTAPSNVPVVVSKPSPAKGGGQSTPMESPSKYGLRNGPPPPISSVDSAPMAPPPAFGAQLHEPLEAALPAVVVADQPAANRTSPPAAPTHVPNAIAAMNDPSVLSVGRIVSGGTAAQQTSSPQGKSREKRRQQTQATTQAQAPQATIASMPRNTAHPSPLAPEVSVHHIDPARTGTPPPLAAPANNTTTSTAAAKVPVPRPNAWSSSAPGKENGAKQQKGESRRRSANTSNTQSPSKKSPATATATGANPDLYPSLEEVLKGEAKPVSKATRQPVTLASIVAGSSQHQPTAPAADTPAGGNNSKKNPSRTKGKSTTSH